MKKVKNLPKGSYEDSTALSEIVIENAIKQAPEKDLKPKVIDPKSKESIYKE